MTMHNLRVNLFLVAVLTFAAYQLQGQSIGEKSFAAQRGMSGGFDLGVAFKENYLAPSATYYELIGLNRGNAFLVGWTARVSSFYGNNLNYYTAPSRLTRLENIDTISFAGLSQTSLNVGIRAELNLGRVQLGASVDLLGLTFLGRSRTGQVYSSSGLFNQNDSLGLTSQKPFQSPDAFQSASPTRVNVKLWGDHDRGMSTTEVYARVYVIPGIALKLGYQWLTTEVTLANRDIVADNARYRNRVGLPYFALTLPLNPW